MTEEHDIRFNIRVNNLGELKQVRYKGIHFENPYLQVNKELSSPLPYSELKEKLLELRKKLEMEEIAGLINKQKFNEIRLKVAKEVAEKTENQALRRNVSVKSYLNSKRNMHINLDTDPTSFNGYSLTDRYLKDLINTKVTPKQMSVEYKRGFHSSSHKSGSALSTLDSRDFSKSKDSGSKSVKNLLKSSSRHSKSTSGKKFLKGHLSSGSKSEFSKNFL